jgi:hypothetical protein
MIDPNASANLLEYTIEKGEERVEGWCMQIADLREQIAKLNRWIDLEQFDIEMAKEMLAKLDGDK